MADGEHPPLPAADREGTDWQHWHDAYDDPSTGLSRRLQVVQARIRLWADGQPAGALRLVSVCAGQGRDVVGALGDHPRHAEVTGLLVELDPGNTATAQAALRAAGLVGLDAVVGDAGCTSAYRTAVPADLVLLCGVFGNVPDDHVRRTIASLRGLCAEGATVIWTRHRREPDLTPAIRAWFGQDGFAEVDFSSPGPGGFAVGTHRLTGAPRPFEVDQRLFEFRM